MTTQGGDLDRWFREFLGRHLEEFYDFTDDVTGAQKEILRRRTRRMLPPGRVPKALPPGRPPLLRGTWTGPPSRGPIGPRTPIIVEGRVVTRGIGGVTPGVGRLGGFTVYQGLMLIALNPHTLRTLPANYKAQVRTNITKRLHELGARIVARASQLTPKDSGLLARSYTYTVTGQRLQVFNKQPYFRYVEKEEHMLQRAWAENYPGMENTIVSDAQNLA